MNDFERPVVNAKAKRSVGVDPVEAAAHRLFTARMDREACPDRVRSGEPCLREERRLAAPPQMQQSFEAVRQHRREVLRCHLRRQRSARSVRQLGRRCEIDPETDDDALAAPLEEDSCNLLSKKEQVVRPFEHQGLPGNGDVDGLDEGKPGCERQGLGLRIGGLQLDKRASVEIAAPGDPRAALPTAPRPLFQCDEPIAFLGNRIGNEVGVCRAGALDDADQKSDPAARSVRALNGPIKR